MSINEATTIITSRKRFLSLDIAEAWRYRHLCLMLIKRDFVAMYKQSILGPLWHIITPLLTTLVFTVIFGNVLNVSTEGVPHILFYLAGVVFWGYFSGNFRQIARFFLDNSHIITKVYFPKLILPLSVIGSKLITLAIQFGIFIVVYIVYLLRGFDFIPGLELLRVVPALFIMTVLSLGVGLIFAALTVKYRDLIHMLDFIVMLWMYASPVIYPLSQIPEKYRWVAAINPVAPLLEELRHVFLGTNPADLSLYLLSAVVSVVLLLIGIVAFNRVDKTFADTI